MIENHAACTLYMPLLSTVHCVTLLQLNLTAKVFLVNLCVNNFVISPWPCMLLGES